MPHPQARRHVACLLAALVLLGAPATAWSAPYRIFVTLVSPPETPDPMLTSWRTAIGGDNLKASLAAVGASGDVIRFELEPDEQRGFGPPPLPDICDTLIRDKDGVYVVSATRPGSSPWIYLSVCFGATPGLGHEKTIKIRVERAALTDGDALEMVAYVTLYGLAMQEKARATGGSLHTASPARRELICKYLRGARAKFAGFTTRQRTGLAVITEAVTRQWGIMGCTGTL